MHPPEVYVQIAQKKQRHGVRRRAVRPREENFTITSSWRLRGIAESGIIYVPITCANIDFWGSMKPHFAMQMFSRIIGGVLIDGWKASKKKVYVLSGNMKKSNKEKFFDYLQLEVA